MKLAAVATAAGVAYALGRLTSRSEVAAARREASTDALTGLPNRHELMRQLRNRTQSRHPHTILLFDLNGFKQVNDTYGHRAGDEVLIRLASRLQARLGRHFLARLGGDEFVVLLDGTRPGEAELAFADHVIRVIEAPLVLTGVAEQLNLGAAVGLARWLRNEDSGVTLHAADQAMYLSKALGGPQLQTGRLQTRIARRPPTRLRDARAVRVA